MRDYIFFYIDINKFSQKCKIVMFRDVLFVENVKRFYAFKTRLKKFFELKTVSF